MIYAFGDCELDTGLYELRRHGERQPVEPQVFDVLVHLVTHRDRVVTKVELLDTVWGDRFVSESALTSRIKAARRAVGDDGRRQSVIRTVHGRGYRVVAAVTERAGAAAAVPGGVLVASGADVDPGSASRPAPGPGAGPAIVTGRVGAAGGGPRSLLGRDRECGALVEALDAAAGGSGRTVFVAGPAGAGTSTLLDWLVEVATAGGWRTGAGVAASVEGAWPYAPVLEAFADLCRRHPTLLDGLDDAYRAEIERALSGHAREWSGDGGHQRLFVAASELLRLAAAGSGAVLAVHDLQEADEASLRLVHYLARVVPEDRVVLVLGYRSGPAGTRSGPLDAVRTSLLGRARAVEIEIGPLGEAELRELVEREMPEPAPEVVDEIVHLSGGLPFAAIELARRARRSTSTGTPVGALVVDGLGRRTRDILEAVAVAGSAFDDDEFVALTGLPEGEARALLDGALGSGVVERTDGGYRFRHAIVRDALLGAVSPHRLRALHREVASRLLARGASSARIAHHLVEAGDRAAAVPHVLDAARTAAALGAHRDALDLVASVRHESDPEHGPALALLRADLLLAIGDPGAIPAYRAALAVAAPDDRRRVRARLGRAAVMSHDLETAAAALDGLQPDAGDEDGTILLAQGMLAYAQGDLDRSWALTNEGHRLVLEGRETWQLLDLIALQGLIAHDRGEWFERLRIELQRSRDAPDLATALFDSHLCVAEFLLYGPLPYEEVVALARSLQATAERAGALRAVAFARAVAGEAALLAGDLETADRELAEAVDLHHDIGAAAGEAHSRQRLAEVRLALGDRDGANELLRRALPLARWSLVALHLIQRIYGTMIRAAADPAAARDVVARAEATIGPDDHCMFCHVMLATPAAIACAAVGDVDDARRHLAAAEESAARWEGTAWLGATCEARAHVARAEGDEALAARLFDEAAGRFDESGQPLDARRCRDAADQSRRSGASGSGSDGRSGSR